MSLKISDNIIGFDKELSFFKNLYNKKCLPNKILFQGLEGIGKYTFVLHLINSLLKSKDTNNIEDKLLNNQNVLILKKNDNSREYKFDEIKNIISFCKYKSLETKSKFIVIKSTNFLNKNSVNALLKLTEEVKEDVYFFFTSNFMLNNSKTLESRFFKKKLFLKKIFYNQIINNFLSENNIENKFHNEIDNNTPGNIVRKYFFELDGNLENLKKNNEDLFYKIVSEIIINKFNKDHIKILKKIKFNLVLKNDISQYLTILNK